MPVIYNLSLPDQGIIILKSQGFSVSNEVVDTELI